MEKKRETPKDRFRIDPEKTAYVPEKTGRGEPCDYNLGRYGSSALRWVTREQDPSSQPLGVREPQETTKVYTGPFSAAGMPYTSRSQLCAKEGESREWCYDIYGRKVFCYRERFPCFDSYDYLYENRYYRWFFFLGDGTMTRVYYSDDQPETYVTEDVRNIENKCWEVMEKLDPYRKGEKGK